MQIFYYTEVSTPNSVLFKGQLYTLVCWIYVLMKNYSQLEFHRTSSFQIIVEFWNWLSLFKEWICSFVFRFNLLLRKHNLTLSAESVTFCLKVFNCAFLAVDLF